MDIHELEFLINEIPRRKYGNDRRRLQKQMLVNQELLNLIKELQVKTTRKPRGRPKKVSPP